MMSWGRQSASHYNIHQWLRSEVGLSLTNIRLLQVVAHYSVKYQATTGSRG